MAKMIVEGLRPRTEARFQDAGDDGDDEDEVPEPKIPKVGGQKRRSRWENLLSVRPTPFYAEPF